MHLPVFALISGTVGGFVGFKGLFVDGFQREVAEYKFELTGLDVVFFDLGQRHTDVPSAVGSLIIGKIDKGEFGVSISLIWIIPHVHDDGLKGTSRPPASAPNGLFKGLQLPLKVLLILFKAFELISDGLEVGMGLSHSDLGTKKEQTNCQKQS